LIECAWNREIAVDLPESCREARRPSERTKPIIAEKNAFGLLRASRRNVTRV
jgi:hypothetical protein